MRTITCLVSTKRSGHHAVIRWLYDGLGQPTCFYNNINGRAVKSGEQTFFGRDGHRQTYRQKRSPSSNSDPGHHIAMNFEGKLAQSVAAILREIDFRSGPRHFGQHFEQFIVLRDPLNTLASCARHFRPHTQPKNLIKFYEQALALQDMIGEATAENHLRPNKLIAYNNWLCDADYRREIAHKLNMARTPDPPSKVTHHGGGSSFSGKKLDDHQALLARWREMSDDPLFLSVFLDKNCVSAFYAYAGIFQDEHAPDTSAIHELVSKARASERARQLYCEWLFPLQAHRDALAIVQLALGTPGYVPAKLRLRLKLRLSRYGDTRLRSGKRSALAG